MAENREHYRRHLPHWQPRGATFFVTFRLKGSLPHEVIELLLAKQEREKRELAARPPGSPQDVPNDFSRWDSVLDDGGFGPRWLLQADVAAIVKEAMHHRDGQEYDLYAFCVMPNHVHAVFEPLEKEGLTEPSLNKIMQSLKRHTARKANMVLGREGPFWQDESYDHAVRNSAGFLRIIHYVLDNPVKARLVSKWEDWPWSYCKPGLLM
jgi:REP element-mobilizing transposase RayT